MFSRFIFYKEYFFEVLGVTLNKIAYNRLMLYHHFFAYLYLISGVSLVLHFVGITPRMFVIQLSLLPSLDALFWYTLVSEVIYEPFFLKTAFCENLAELFVLMWSGYESIYCLYFFDLYLHFLFT